MPDKYLLQYSRVFALESGRLADETIVVYRTAELIEILICYCNPSQFRTFLVNLNDVSNKQTQTSC